MMYKILVHGGAGTIRKSDMTEDLEAAYCNGLSDAVEAGFSVLTKNGSAIQSVLAAVTSLEDNILFNAGRGSVFGYDGSHEMDASVMDGSTRMAGAVSSVRFIKNPVLLAHTIMTKSDHVFLNGEGALAFAKQQGLRIEPEEYFFSPFRHTQWQQLQLSGGTALDHHVASAGQSPLPYTVVDKKFGTVGAVALDSMGNIAAATSTGGITNKRWGRVGDSPVIGAGTYAHNETCAISCTGYGEAFIRAVAAYDVSCLMEYKGLSLQEAMNIVVFEKLPPLDGEGGMIGVDAKGNSAMLFNSEGMYRGSMGSDQSKILSVYKESE